MTWPLGRRGWLPLAAVVTAVVVLAAGLLVREGLSGRLSPVDQTHTAIVGEGGYDETFDHGGLGRISALRVVVPAGAVPAGTSITVRVLDDWAAIGMVPDGSWLAGTGLAADIAFGGGVRPSGPLTVEMATGSGEGGTVLAATRTDDGPAPVSTVRVQDGRRVTYRATVDGPGPVAFYRVDVDRLWSGIEERWSASADREYRQPDCASASVTVGGRSYSAGRARQVDGAVITDREEPAVIACLGAADDDMLVDLYGTASPGLRVHPEVEPASMKVHGRVAGSPTDDSVRELAEALAGKGYVLPGFATRMQYSRAAGQIVLTADPAPALILATVPALAQAIAEVDQAAGRPDSACLLAHLDRLGRDRTPTALLAGIVTCLQTGASKSGAGRLAAAALGAVGGELGARAAELDGMRRVVEAPGRSVVVVSGAGQAPPTTIAVDPDAGQAGAASPSVAGTGVEQVIPADLGATGGGRSGRGSGGVSGGGTAGASGGGGTGSEHGAAGGSALAVSEFRSPDDSIACQIGGVFGGAFGGDFHPRVACLTNPWTGPKLPVDCSAFGNISALPYGAAISSSGRAAYGFCAGGVPFSAAVDGMPADTLAYGSRTQVGSVYCISRPSGMTCGDSSSGESFTISTRQILLNGTPAG